MVLIFCVVGGVWIDDGLGVICYLFRCALFWDD